MTGEKNEKQDLDSACPFEEAVREERLRIKKQLETAQAVVDEQIESSLRTKERIDDAIKRMNETITETIRDHVMSWHTEHATTPDTIKKPRDNGMLNRIRAAKERQKTQLEAMKIHWKGQLERLTLPTNAAVEDSRAFWNARSADICEKIKAYAQSNTYDLSNDILAKREEAICNVFLVIDQYITSVAESEMDERLKEECIKKLLDLCLSTIEKLEKVV